MGSSFFRKFPELKPTEYPRVKHTGKIIVLAYPDTYVLHSNEWFCKVLPWFGLGTREYIKAGHAALVLIDDRTGEARYYDFGRYITPHGFGRVRSRETDAELHLPLHGEFDDGGALLNLDQFLVWLDAHPERTHGSGRLLASVCATVEWDKAFRFIHELQARGSIPYGAFVRNGSNCARFVTDTLLASSWDSSVRRLLRRNKRFTPSTVGNVEKASSDGLVFQVRNGEVRRYSGSALKENLRNYFDRKRPEYEHDFNSEDVLTQRAQWLDGIGSGAWFELVDEALPDGRYRIRRYNGRGVMDHEAIYYSTELDCSRPFQFTYDSHCAYCHIVQDGRTIRLENLSVSRADQFIAKPAWS